MVKRGQRASNDMTSPFSECETVTSLPDSWRVHLGNVIAEHLGLHFPPERWTDLERGLRAAAREAARPDVAAYAQTLLSPPLSPEEIDRLASHLTVGETYFFRDRPIVEALEEHILPALIDERRATTRHVRLWSAGCASGEEPYSLAILLTKLLPDITEWQITLLATDLNPRALRKAADAIYSEWSFRGVAPAIKQTYFQPVASERWRVRPEIRRLVSFARLNLAEDVYPSPATHTQAMDLILCCNVLMYFTPEQAQRVVERFHRCLCEGGWLIVGPSEVSHTLFSSFASVSFPGAIAYRKERGLSRRIAFRSFVEERADEPPEEKGVAESPPGELTERQEEPGSPSAEPVVLHSLVAEAQALYRQGRVEEAQERLRESLRCHPTPEAMRLLARISADRGELAEALEWCDRAIAGQKLAPESHYLRGLILQDLGQMDEAVQSLRRALYLDPDHALVHLALGHLVWRQGRLRDARKHLERALALLNDRPTQRLSEADSLTTREARALIRSLLDGEITR